MRVKKFETSKKFLEKFLEKFSEIFSVEEIVSKNSQTVPKKKFLPAQLKNFSSGKIPAMRPVDTALNHLHHEFVLPTFDTVRSDAVQGQTYYPIVRVAGTVCPSAERSQ
jgi:hypothetical protein